MSQLKHSRELIPRWKKWLIAARPWALPASAIPVALGTLLALSVGRSEFHPGRFGLALLAMVLLHFGANMLSDVFDYRRGLDTEVTPVSGAIVRQWLSAEEVMKGAILLFLLGSTLGIWLALMSHLGLLLIGLLGVAIGLNYHFLKAHALGDLAVFLNFGVLGSLGAWVVQTGKFSVWPALWAVPQALLVVAILHANNWRDSISDQEKRVVTVASLLGDHNSLVYYSFLLLAPFFLFLIYIFLPRFCLKEFPSLPLSLLLVLAALPGAFSLLRRARRRHHPRQPLEFIILDGATSKFNWVFGLLCLAGLGIDVVRRLF